MQTSSSRLIGGKESPMSEQIANITALIDSDLAVTAITLAQERNRPPDWQL